MKLPQAEIHAAVKKALAEDIGEGDATTLATVPAHLHVQAVMRARESLVVAGLEFVETAFRQLSRKIKIEKLAADGEQVARGKSLLKISGTGPGHLERGTGGVELCPAALGIATLTARFVQEVKGTRAKILDTRKTTPGWRSFEKYAVACGGGTNHRKGLYDMILIKDNHLAALRNEKPNPIAAAILRARKKYPALPIEVEADNLAQAAHAAEAGADIILLDNMDLKRLRLAVKIIHHRAKTEASGGVSLKTVRAIARTGVDFISVGALTHSARAVDIGLDFE